MNKCVSASALRAALSIAALVCASGVAGAQTVPSPWANRDIGAPALAGSASYGSGVFTVQGAGSDIYYTSDHFHFVYQQVSGDVEIIARVDSLTQQHRWSKAGVMIRSSLNANSAHGYALVSADMGVHFQYRASAGGSSASVAGSATAEAPVWLRAVRRGTRITTYRSTNGSTWTTIGSATISLGSSAYVGIAVTSHNPSARSTARVSNVRVTKIALPSGQQSADIGAPAVRGSASYASGRYTIKGAGADIWDVSDQFHFVYQPMTGNIDVSARVVSLTNTDEWAKAGVMIRESLTGKSRHAMMLTSVSKGRAFQRRPTTGGYSEHTSGGSGTAPVWVRLRRSGDLFEAYRSSDGSNWTRVGADTIPMNDTVYVGLAVTSHNPSQATTAVVENLRITGTTSSNRPPTVTLATNAASFTAPASIALTATASDPEGRLARVEFYNGSTRLSSDTTSPFSFSWTNVAAGTYTLTARAFDAEGASASSPPVTITVKTSSGTTAPRLVAFTASSDHATNVTSYTLKVFAAGANLSTATPVATSNLGKPTPSSTGQITVDRASFFSALPVGNYQATVTAIGPGGQTSSAPVSFTR